MRSLFVGGLLIAASAAAAVAQDTTVAIAGDRAATAELSKIIDGARANGLPVRPIIAKVNYGILMKAATPRIIAAARGTAARLEEARNALAPHPTDSDVAAGESALSSKVSTKSLQDIRKASGNRPVAVPLGVLTQLVANEVDESKATKIVVDLIHRSVTTDQLIALGNGVKSDVEAGTKPNLSAELRLNGLTAVLGVPSAASAAGDALSAGASAPTVPKKKP
jgi:hypothetical protein